MSEETTSSNEPTESLDDVINQFSAPSPIQPAPVAEPKATPQVQPLSTFDPLDQDSVNQYVQKSSEGYTALTSQLQNLQTELTNIQQSKMQEQVEAEIKQAASKVSEVAGIEPDMAEFILEKTARENPGFKQIWENRTSNPKAYNKALTAISNEAKAKYEMRQDPQLAENQRAAKQSQQSMSTSNQPDDDWPDAGTPEFARKWEQLKAGG